MIKNLSNLLNKIYEIIESDGVVLMKITFKNPNVVSDFTNNYLSTVLNRHSAYSNFVIISLTKEFASYTADILSAAQDYDAKKIKLTFYGCQTLPWKIGCTIDIEKQ